MFAKRPEVAGVAVEMSAMHLSADEQYDHAVPAAHNLSSGTIVSRVRVQSGRRCDRVVPVAHDVAAYFGEHAFEYLVLVLSADVVARVVSAVVACYDRNLRTICGRK